MGRVGQDVTRSQCDGADLARARVRESERQRRTQASLPVYNPQALEAHRAEQVVRSRQEEKASHMIVNGLQRFLRTTAVMLRKGQDRDANTMESERWEGRALKTTSHPRMARMARIMKECHQRRQPWTTGETTRRTAKILVQALTTVLKRGRLLWMTARLAGSIAKGILQYLRERTGKTTILLDAHNLVQSIKKVGSPMLSAHVPCWRSSATRTVETLRS
ncbi:hypothetical protein PI126_g17946 [Phytophthora idaei]|nr:hypothetical protein PI126_g17946 [Phytophthora idaei]